VVTDRFLDLNERHPRRDDRSRAVRHELDARRSLGLAGACRGTRRTGRTYQKQGLGCSSVQIEELAAAKKEAAVAPARTELCGGVKMLLHPLVLTKIRPGSRRHRNIHTIL
jgi:hypothetical protein